MITDVTLEQVRKNLQQAVELEFSTIPPYLMAAISMMPQANRKPFEVVHSVYLEEMLHLVLAANVLMAIGGEVKMGKEQLPAYPLRIKFDGKDAKDREFDIHLEAFTKSALETFMKIELPDGWGKPVAIKEAVDDTEIKGYTIGEFYGIIQDSLRQLCKEMGEKAVFSGNPAHQIDENYYWGSGGRPIQVKDLKTALLALEIIIDQGEGVADHTIFDGNKRRFHEDKEVAHFYKFRELYFGREYTEHDDPYDPPTGKPIAVDYDQVYPIKKDCTSKDLEGTPQLMRLNQTFNSHYTTMLQGLEAAFQGSPQALYSAIMSDMHQMAVISMKMVQIPIKNDPEGKHGAPTFEWVDLPND